MMGCKKCAGICGSLMLLLGVLFLLKDLGVLTLAGINWWTALFLLWGVGTLAMRSCPDCQALCGWGAKKK